MRIERLKPTVLRVTLHAYELSALVSAARWAAGGAEGVLPPEAVTDLRRVLDNYDSEIRRADSRGTEASSDGTHGSSGNGRSRHS